MCLMMVTYECIISLRGLVGVGVRSPHASNSCLINRSNAHRFSTSTPVSVEVVGLHAMILAGLDAGGTT